LPVRPPPNFNQKPSSWLRFVKKKLASVPQFCMTLRDPECSLRPFFPLSLSPSPLEDIPSCALGASPVLSSPSFPSPHQYSVFSGPSSRCQWIWLWAHGWENPPLFNILFPLKINPLSPMKNSNETETPVFYLCSCGIKATALFCHQVFLPSLKPLLLFLLMFMFCSTCAIASSIDAFAPFLEMEWDIYLKPTWSPTQEAPKSDTTSCMALFFFQCINWREFYSPSLKTVFTPAFSDTQCIYLQFLRCTRIFTPLFTPRWAHGCRQLILKILLAF